MLGMKLLFLGVSAATKQSVLSQTRSLVEAQRFWSVIKFSGWKNDALRGQHSIYLFVYFYFIFASNVWAYTVMVKHRTVDFGRVT